MAALWLASSCKENSYEGFENKGAVYFQTNSENWTKIDSLVNYSFVGKPVDRDTVLLQVNLMGDPSGVDRKFKLAANKSETNAVEGQDYLPLDEYYYIKKGEMTAKVPLVVCRTARMSEQPVTVSLRLEATDDLELGLFNRLAVRVVLTDILMEPVWWNTPCDPFVGTPHEGYLMMKAADYYGPYSRRKHELCVQILGRDFPDDIMTFVYGEYWAAAMAYMSEYFQENYPVYDEIGNAIEPW